MWRSEEIHPSPPLEMEEIPSRSPLIKKGRGVRGKGSAGKIWLNVCIWVTDTCGIGVCLCYLSD
jgi:hypothetical protein